MYAAIISVRASVGRLLAVRLALRLAGFVATERGLNFASRLVQLRIVHVDVELFGDLEFKGNRIKTNSVYLLELLS